jgi:uncharacterized protein (DUF4415 family)
MESCGRPFMSGAVRSSGFCRLEGATAVNKESTVGLPADPDDADDFDVSLAGLAKALAEREIRRGVRGQQRAPTKARVSIRLDRDVVEKLRGMGKGWQSRANEILRKAVL